MRNRYLATLLLTIVALSPDIAVAQTDCEGLRNNLLEASTNGERVLLIGRMTRSGCLGGASDDWPLASELDERLDPGDTESAARLADAAVIATVKISDRAREAKNDPATPEIGDAFTKTALRLRELARILKRGGADDLDAASWRQQNDLSIHALPSVTPRSTFIESPCESDGDGCRNALKDAMEFFRLTHAAERVIENVTTRGNELKLATRLARDDERWDAYFTEARTQFPQELWLNSLLYSREKDEKYCDGLGGFCTPPDSQWILMHPNVALEYIDDSPAGNRAEPAIVLELIGYNRWTWDGSKMDNAIGGSIIAVASDRAGEDDFGYGLMFHYDNKWSLGVTRHGDVNGIFLSYSLWDTAKSEVDGLKDDFTNSQ